MKFRINCYCCAGECSMANYKDKKSNPQSIATLLDKKLEWGKNSTEYKARILALKQMIIGTGSTISLLDHPDFRQLMKTLDPRFKLPGIIYL